MKQKTYSAKAEDIKRERYLINAEGQVLGRLASRVAELLRGKHKPLFTPHVDCGDLVTVFNAEKVKVTGNKEKQKVYFSHSGYHHGHKLLTYREKKRRDPRQIIYLAVRGMLPHNTLGEAMLKKLTIEVGSSKEKGKEVQIR